MTAPIGYDAIKALSQATGHAIPDLLGMSRVNDPFFFGSPAHRRDAEWFADWWHRLGVANQTGVHLRAIHYRLVSQSPAPTLPNGDTYLNTLECWAYLTAASKAARYLRLVDVEAFEDHRNPDPALCASQLETEPREFGLDDWFEWELPEITAGWGSFSLPMPRIEVSGFEYQDAHQPYHLELWVEKSTMNSVLRPICRIHGINLVTALGFQSVTSVIDLLRRVQEHGKPARVLFISDFDPAGSFMPDAVARQIEYWRYRLDVDVEIKLHPLALTCEQVMHYELPGIPIKESDRRKGGFERRYGMNATELDALEALRPGELGRIVRDAIAPYRDSELSDRWEAAKDEAEETARDAEQWVTDNVQVELQAIQTGVREITERYRDRIDALNTELQRDLDPYRPRMTALREAVNDALQSVPEVFELPEAPVSGLPEPDDDHWLFDSGREYLDQLEHYKARRNTESLL